MLLHAAWIISEHLLKCIGKAAEVIVPDMVSYFRNIHDPLRQQLPCLLHTQLVNIAKHRGLEKMFIPLLKLVLIKPEPTGKPLKA